ncbi:MAG: GGDEF domain-containing protein [Clostridia bacterium]
MNRFGAVMCDLDKFKYINDTFGHDSGDRALIQFAECVRGSIRKEDVFARIGGDEFAMIIECNDLESCRSFVGKLYKKTASLELEGTSHPIHASFGYAHINEGGGPEELMKRADDSLYEAKKRL